MEQEASYCLDIRVGYYLEQERESLIKFLKKIAKEHGIAMEAERGMWLGTKILRIYTTNAKILAQYIIDGLLNGDDFDYEIHHSQIDAFRCEHYLPDYDTKAENGCAKFNL